LSDSFQDMLSNVETLSESYLEEERKVETYLDQERNVETLSQYYIEEERKGKTLAELYTWGESTVWYCAYGTYMSRECMTKKISASAIIGNPVVVRFMDKRLVFNKHSSRNEKAGFANLENCHGGLQAEAVIWQLTYSAISVLDKLKFTPTHYIRETWVSRDCLTKESLKDAPEKFEVHIANPQRVRDDLRPPRKYIHNLQTGAEEFNLSHSFQEMLGTVETLSESYAHSVGCASRASSGHRAAVAINHPSPARLAEEKSTVWYCAYGSDMSRERITQRISAREIIGDPVAVQFMAKRLVFNKQSSRNYKAGFANLANWKEGVRAEAVIWRITDNAIRMLDRIDGTPTHYIRETWASKDYLTNKSLKVAPEKFEIYIANPHRVCDNVLPRKEYLCHLQTGAKEFKLSTSFQEMLSKVETLS